MGYAHDAQRALARIAVIRGDSGAQAKWSAAMATTAAALRRRLWREDRGACYDRERDGKERFVDALVHNNLRAMWHGVFDQHMADEFVARHLMNRSEFWTPTPLPSIAASDPRFRDPPGTNNWSGPPEGLTFQRTIRALESYGHHAEVLMIGAELRRSLFKEDRFPQQIDPFTSVPFHGDCYGPMLLSLLEYTARATGIAVRPVDNRLLWTSANRSASFTFEQRIGDVVYALEAKVGGRFSGRRAGKLLFAAQGPARVVTDPSGCGSPPNSGCPPGLTAGAGKCCVWSESLQSQSSSS